MTAWRESGFPSEFLEGLERAVALLADYSEANEWPPAPDVNIGHIEDYFAYLQVRPRWFGERDTEGTDQLSPGYINLQYRRLRRFFRWLEERDHVGQNAMLLMKPPRLEEKTVPLVSDRQVENLLALLNPRLARTPKERFLMLRNRTIVYLFVDTPGRLNEIADMKLDDAQPDENRVRVMGKGGRERFMPIGRSARSVLSEYLQAREAIEPFTRNLWVSGTGDAMQHNWLYLMLKRLSERARIKGLHPHMFRHTFAVSALRSGMPERVLMHMGGWRKIPDTYFRALGFEDAQAFHAVMSPGNRFGDGSAMKYGPGRRGAKSRPKGRL